MYTARNGLGLIVRTTQPIAAPSAEATPAWWEAPLSQAAQAAADWASSHATGVPTYGGAPAYPVGTPGYQYYDAPPPLPPPVEASMGGGSKALLLVGAVALGAKLLGAF